MTKLNETTKAYIRNAVDTPMGLLQLKTLLRGLRLEERTGGQMRLTAKAPRCTTLARRWLGIKGSRPKLLAQVEHIHQVATRYRRLAHLAEAEADHQHRLKHAREGVLWYYRGSLWARMDGEGRRLIDGLEPLADGRYRYGFEENRREGTVEEILAYYGFETEAA